MEIESIEEGDEFEVWLYRMALTIAERRQMVLAIDGEPVELVEPADVSGYLFDDHGAHEPDSMVVLPASTGDENQALAQVESGEGRSATLDDWDDVLVDYAISRSRHDDTPGP